jgi:hypothetical protein
MWRKTGNRLHRNCVLLTAPALLVLVCGAAGVRAQEFSFNASVDKATLGLYDQLTLTISASGSGITSVGEPKLPPLDDFQVLGRSSSQSSQLTIVNGKVSSVKTVDYVYVLQPRKTGKLTIGSAQVSFKGKTYQTEPIAVEVAFGSAQGKPSPSTPSAPTPAVSGRNVFLNAHADRTTVYVGQQLVIDYWLYTSVELANVRLGDVPSYSGFWSEELFAAKRLDFTQKVIDGKRYSAAPIKKVALFPTTSGDFAIEPMSIICDVPVRTGDMFRDMWGASQTAAEKSTPISVKVLPLPAEGRPEGWSGAVGSFKLSVDCSPQSVKVGEPVYVTLKISGRGNLRTLEAPKLPEIGDFKVYEPEVNFDLSTSGDYISGTKTCKYMLVPNSEGKHVIPALAFSFFDPSDKKYHRLTTDEIVLNAQPGELAQGAGGPGTRGPVQILGRDIRYIKPDLQAVRIGRGYLYQNHGFQALQILPAIALLLAFVYQKQRQRIETDIAYARARRAKALASSRLKEAYALLSKGELPLVPSAIARAIAEYAGDRMNVSAAGLTLDRILDGLQGKGVSEEVLCRFKACIEQCDLARFAARPVDEAAIREMLRLAGETIERMEKIRFK